jgi:hypothetical protein
MRKLIFVESTFPMYDFDCETGIGEYGISNYSEDWFFYAPTGGVSEPLPAKAAAIEAAQKDYESRCMALCGDLEWIGSGNVSSCSCYLVKGGDLLYTFDPSAAKHVKIGSYTTLDQAKEAANRHHKLEWLKQSKL